MKKEKLIDQIMDNILDIFMLNDLDDTIERNFEIHCTLEFKYKIIDEIEDKTRSCSFIREKTIGEISTNPETIFTYRTVNRIQMKFVTSENYVIPLIFVMGLKIKE